MELLSRIIYLVLFSVAFFLAGVAVLERLIRVFGFTILGGLYNPGRLLEFAAMALVFVIALQLRDIKILLLAKSD